MYVMWQGFAATALMIAAQKGHDEVARLLLQHGANVNHQVSTEDPSRHAVALPLALRCAPCSKQFVLFV